MANIRGRRGRPVHIFVSGCLHKFVWEMAIFLEP